MEKGYFQIYTGDGKGKTTAALGLAVRAAGAGLKVYIGQFIKSMEYHEVSVLRSIPGITVELYGLDGCIVTSEPSDRDRLAARRGYERAAKVLRSGEYALVILDEFTIATYFKLITEEEALSLVESRAPGTELVITGRYAPDSLLARADLVTDMRCLRHYYEVGVEARDGIER
jgi:cob(I)alamin adenosyltransferase